MSVIQSVGKNVKKTRHVFYAIHTAIPPHRVPAFILLKPPTPFHPPVVSPHPLTCQQPHVPILMWRHCFRSIWVCGCPRSFTSIPDLFLSFFICRRPKSRSVKAET
ncbi:hypothetical protein CDAR_448791 [Caerostris darwini]|uniref:Uncharacterized protein n=1 Tax=Caerostris darwini TaxID=1538125 RepID=A0AAV4QL65_9ARAC|nr:hypothetical protein CDAR_448791 [Caerostris darwini]